MGGVNNLEVDMKAIKIEVPDGYEADFNKLTGEIRFREKPRNSKTHPFNMDRLKVSDILVEGANLDTEEVDFKEKPEVAALYKETQDRQEELKKLKEVDEEQLKLVVQL